MGKKVLRKTTRADVIEVVGQIRELRVNARISTNDYTANMNLNSGLELAVDVVEEFFGTGTKETDMGT